MSGDFDINVEGDGVGWGTEEHLVPDDEEDECAHDCRLQRS